NILLPAPLTVVQIRELDAWLRTFAGGLETRSNTSGDLEAWCFRVDNASALGLLGSFPTCIIGLALVEPSREWDGDEAEQIMKQLGFWPRQGINIYAMCKNFPTGRVMSYLTLRLMERYAGYLDFCMREKVAELTPLTMEDIRQEQHTPGKTYTIRYWAPDSDYAGYFSCWWEAEVIDSERLRWWLQDDTGVLIGFRQE
ncbi:MAG TPA: DUF6368 family protein, partial [Ktedonobacteraceae bacterium]|nr:DUF6368 family protein [Ktedonobacteraceae bacterium]